MSLYCRAVRGSLAAGRPVARSAWHGFGRRGQCASPAQLIMANKTGLPRAATWVSWLLLVSRLIGLPAYVGTVFSALPTFYCRYSVYLALPIPLHCGDIFILWFQPAERVHFALHNKTPAMRECRQLKDVTRFTGGLDFILCLST